MGDRRRPGRRERAVSEIIGYILVFALIVATVGLVSVGGLPTLDSARESEQVQNAERAFDVLDSNMAEVYERGAPSRATELNAEDATVEIREAVTFNVSAENGDGNVSYTEAAINPIVFTGIGETEFVYEAGAVIRDQRDRSIMLSEPPFNVSSRRAVFTVVETENPVRQSTGGGTVLVRGETRDRSVDLVETDADGYEHINVTISDSPRQDVWEEYFEDELGMSCNNGASLDCSLDDPDVEQIFLATHQIRVNLEI